MLELRAMFGGTAQERDVPAAEANQVLRCPKRAADVVTAEIVAGLLVDDRAPDDEVRVRFRKRFQLFPIGNVIAITEQDDAVGAMTRFVPAMPVLAQLLERHEHGVIDAAGGAGDAAEQREKERVDL